MCKKDTYIQVTRAVNGVYIHATEIEIDDEVKKETQ